MVELDIYDMIVFEDESKFGSVVQDFVKVINNKKQVVYCRDFSIDISTTITKINPFFDSDGRKWHIKEIWKRKDKETYKRVYYSEEK